MGHIDRSRLGLLLLGTVMCLLCSLAYGEETLEIVPASPRSLEPVYARYNPGFYWCLMDVQISMSGTGITLQPRLIVDICNSSHDIELGRFPAGNYTVQVGKLVAQFTVTPPMSPRSPWVDYSGMWWNVSESGWGLSISQGPTNQFFAVWFVYDAAGMPTWYTLEMGRWEGNYEGRVYRYTGPHYASIFDPGKVAGTEVGTGTLGFTNANTGYFYYTIEGTSGFKSITRVPIE